MLYKGTKFMWLAESLLAGNVELPLARGMRRQPIEGPLLHPDNGRVLRVAQVLEHKLGPTIHLDVVGNGDWLLNAHLDLSAVSSIKAGS